MIQISTLSSRLATDFLSHVRPSKERDSSVKTDFAKVLGFTDFTSISKPSELFFNNPITRDTKDHVELRVLNKKTNTIEYIKVGQERNSGSFVLMSHNQHFDIYDLPLVISGDHEDYRVLPNAEYLSIKISNFFYDLSIGSVATIYRMAFPEVKTQEIKPKPTPKLLDRVVDFTKAHAKTALLGSVALVAFGFSSYTIYNHLVTNTTDQRPPIDQATLASYLPTTATIREYANVIKSGLTNPTVQVGGLLTLVLFCVSRVKEKPPISDGSLKLLLNHPALCLWNATWWNEVAVEALSIKKSQRSWISSLISNHQSNITLQYGTTEAVKRALNDLENPTDWQNQAVLFVRADRFDLLEVLLDSGSEKIAALDWKAIVKEAIRCSPIQHYPATQQDLIRKQDNQGHAGPSLATSAAMEICFDNTEKESIEDTIRTLSKELHIDWEYIVFEAEAGKRMDIINAMMNVESIKIWSSVAETAATRNKTELLIMLNFNQAVRSTIDWIKVLGTAIYCERLSLFWQLLNNVPELASFTEDQAKYLIENCKNPFSNAAGSYIDVIKRYTQKK